MLLGTCDGHIEQASLFLQRSHGVACHRAGEEVFLQTHHEHRAKFQPLGTVHRHDSDARTVVFGVRILIGEERHFREIVRE